MYSTAEAATQIGVAKVTLLRWIAEGRLPDVARDWRNWRCWSEADIDRARTVRIALHGEPSVGAVAPSAAAGAAPEGQQPTEVVTKPHGRQDYAQDLSRLGSSRRFRGPRAKPQVMNAGYGSELSRLGEARALRQPTERRHGS